MNPFLFPLLFGISALGIASLAAEEESHPLPEEIGELRFLDRKDYDKPGLGFSLRYEGPGFLKADIYLYDLDQKDLPDGIDSPHAAAQMKEIDWVIREFERRGHYEDVERTESGTKSLGKDQIAFLWNRHRYRQNHPEHPDDSEPRISESFLRIEGGKFLKIRITTLEADFEEHQEQIEGFLDRVAAGFRAPGDEG